MTEEVISFWNCAAVPQEPQLVIPAQAPEEQKVLSVSSDVSALSDGSDMVAGYRIVARAVRRLVRWITVTAELFCRAVISRVRAYVRSAVRMSGVQILREFAILRF